MRGLIQGLTLGALATVLAVVGAVTVAPRAMAQAGMYAAVVNETIDATQVGRQFCYGKLLTGGLTVAIASGGAAPDVTITYQGQ